MTSIPGWHSDRPIFKRLIETTRPKVVIELGSWFGASIIHMAKTARDLGLDTHFYAVDFWSPDVVIDGRTACVDDFLRNVAEEGLSLRITPIRMDTIQASAYFVFHGIKADLIYIDADHTFSGCLADMLVYWPILTRGGVMFGDDYSEIPTVKTAVEAFCAQQGSIHVADHYHWELLPKP